MRSLIRALVFYAPLLACVGALAEEPQLERIQFNNPGLVVDLGVGLWAWPLPMDYDQDGDLDLVVSCPDKPYNGSYFFENPGQGPGSQLGQVPCLNFHHETELNREVLACS